MLLARRESGLAGDGFRVSTHPFSHPRGHVRRLAPQPPADQTGHCHHQPASQTGGEQGGRTAHEVRLRRSGVGLCAGVLRGGGGERWNEEPGRERKCKFYHFVKLETLPNPSVENGKDDTQYYRTGI